MCVQITFLQIRLNSDFNFHTFSQFCINSDCRSALHLGLGKSQKSQSHIEMAIFHLHSELHCIDGDINGSNLRGSRVKQLQIRIYHNHISSS